MNVHQNQLNNRNMKLEIDNTPMMSEIFKTQAYIKTFASILLSEEQKKEFDEKFAANYKNVISEFLETVPNSIDNAEELKNALSDNS